MKTIKTEQGFTIIEIVMTLVILGILGVMSMNFIATSSGIYKIASDEAKVYGELWVTTERITREIAESTCVVDSGTQITITDTAKTSCTNCVDNGTTIIYRLNGTTLERNSNGGTFYTMADNISITGASTAIFSQVGTLITVEMTKTEDNYSLTLKTIVNPNSAIVEDVK